MVQTRSGKKRTHDEVAPDSSFDDDPEALPVPVKESKQARTGPLLKWLDLGEELHTVILSHLNSTSLGKMEQTCTAFAPPRPALSPVQRAIQKKLRVEFPGATLGRMTDPHLYSKHEAGKVAAESWDDTRIVSDLHTVFLSPQADASVLGERDGHAGGVKKMVQKLRQRVGNNWRQQASHSRNVSYLLRAMARLAARDKNRDALVSAGVVAPLMNLLSNGIEDTHVPEGVGNVRRYQSTHACQLVGI